MLAAVWNGGPELAVENFAVRFDQDSRIGHFIFVGAENLAEIFDLLIHAIEHLADGVDFYFAVFELLESKTDGQMFRQLHQHGFIRLGLSGLRRQAGDSLPQRHLRIAWQLRNLLLERSRAGDAALVGSNLSKAGERG